VAGRISDDGPVAVARVGSGQAVNGGRKTEDKADGMKYSV
jgi:hypothetical protein